MAMRNAQSASTQSQTNVDLLKKSGKETDFSLFRINLSFSQSDKNAKVHFDYHHFASGEM